MKTSSFVISTLAALAGHASAASCTSGLNYCGYNLLKKGHYTEEIGAELRKSGYPIDRHNINHGLFSCGEGGWIGLLGVCDGDCVDGGSGKDDGCW